MVVKRDIWSEDIASGLVVKTQPAAGEQYAVGATVALFVSKGPVETRVKVPSVVGLTEEKAVAMLKENKLKAEVKEIEHEGDKGKVIDRIQMKAHMLSVTQLLLFTFRPEKLHLLR